MKKIFICYSHKDEAWKNRLNTHLKVLEKEGLLSVWFDSKIQPGLDWEPEIEKALNSADIAILMISADFLISDFILEKEVPRIMERRKKEGMRVIPLFVNPCAWKKIPWLSKIQGIPNNGTTLEEIGKPQAEKCLSDLAEMVSDIVFPKEIENIGSASNLLTPLPPRRIVLIGRKDDLKNLEDKLNHSERVVLVNGMGGIGKTEVCKKFFHEQYKNYTHAAWVDFVSSIKETLVSAFGNEKFKLIETGSQDTLDDRFDKVMEFLTGLKGETLLIVDNIENPDDPDLDKLCSFPANIKVIANSRVKLNGFDLISLDFLSFECCKELFYEYYQGERDDAAVEKIIHLCNRHTLSVELLARTAHNAAKSLNAFYEIVERQGFNLNKVIGEEVETFYRNEKKKRLFFDHILKIFDLSNVSEAELHVLVNVSVLPAIYIPIETISEWMKLETKNEINSLEQKGWLKRDKGSIFMHQVIQEVIRHKKATDVNTCKNLIVSLILKLHLEPTENPIDKKEYIIYADSLLSHINEKDKNLAKLANNLSLRYQDMGQLEKALEFQEKALKIREAVLDKNHPDLATSYNNLSLIYKYMGQYEKALEFQLKDVKISKKVLGKNHPDLAASYNNLSLIYKYMGQLEKALEFQEKALKIREAVSDKNHPNLATSYNNLSTIYRDMGQLKKALEFQLKTVKIFEAVLDKNHPDLATSYNNLSTIYSDMGQPAKALPYSKKAVAIMEYLFPDGHPNLTIFKRNLESLKR